MGAGSRHPSQPWLLSFVGYICFIGNRVSSSKRSERNIGESKCVASFSISTERAVANPSQEAFRNNILSMREQARASTLSLSLPRGDSYRDVDYGPSEPPRSVLYSATKSSGLRNNFSDDTDADSMEEALVASNEDDDFNARNRARGMPSGGRL